MVSAHQPEGMQTLESSLTTLVAAGAVDLEQARLVSLHPREVEAPVVPEVVEASGRFGRKR